MGAMGRVRPHPATRRGRKAGSSLASGILALAMLVLSGCDGALDPQGARSEPITLLWWWMLGLAGAVCVLVTALTVVAAVRPNRRVLPALRGRGPTRPIVLGGIVLPLVVVVPLFAWGLVIDQRVLAEDDDDLVIEVTGHRFWWEVHYPAEGVTTANEIHIPVGRPVRVELTSTDVIHSFWVPSLGGKADLIPGRTNKTYIESDHPGRFRGQCAEYCGIQHAQMRLSVVAHPVDEFDEWASQQGAPAAAIDTDEDLADGHEIFVASGCVSCHTVEGHPGSSGRRIGPDLTHLQSRETIAAGTLLNNRGNLAGWILDPQQLKPGATMPATQLSGQELESLLDYLEGLR